MSRAKNRKSYEVIIGIILISIFCLETIGYAALHTTIKLQGVSTFVKGGKIEITDISLANVTNAIETSAPIYSDTTANFFLKYNVTNIDGTYEAAYNVTVENSMFFDYLFAGTNFGANINVEDGSVIDFRIEGVDVGDKIEKQSSKTFTLVIILNPKTENTDYEVTTEYEPDIKGNSNGNLLGTISSSKTGNLRGSNKLAHFTFDVINTYEVDKYFDIFVNSSGFELCDSTGGSLSTFEIGAGESDTFDFYVKTKNDASFPNDTEYLNVMLTSSGLSDVNMGKLTLLVDPNFVEDEDAPVISNVTASKGSATNHVTVSWNGSDTSSIVNYTVIAYNNSNTEVARTTTEGNETTIDLALSNNTNNIDGNYYFKVYGVDSLGNTATTSEINNATTSSGHCSRSASTALKWYAKVSYSGSYSGNVTQVLIGETLTVPINVGGGTPYINSITMNGTALNNNQYTTSTNGTTITVTITGVTGDVNIEAASFNICLVEGTKVKLANGNYKNIEDITYYDLLEVWNYETGEITYEYPIWIEKEGITNYYQENIFSDGTILNTVGFHGIYSVDDNEFISVDDKDKFHIGVNVLKIKDGKLSNVKVTNINQINKKVNYYHVVSSRYYNILANDLLTTDGTVMLSNLYGFNDNITWKVKNNNEVYSYEEFKDIVPFYMFNGMRMGESKYLNRFGLDLNTFKEYLLKNQLNPLMLKPMLKVNNKIKFIISTSTGEKKFILENDYYTLPGNNKKWLNTLDNKIYKSNDKIKITNSMHFIEIK